MIPSSHLLTDHTIHSDQPDEVKACRALFTTILHVACNNFLAGERDAEVYFDNNSHENICEILEINAARFKAALIEKRNKLKKPKAINRKVR